jgi:hypothetical protein
MTNVYVENGYDNRQHYLMCLAEDYGLPLSVVFSFADMLGSSEDFDGLICELEDAVGRF